MQANEQQHDLYTVSDRDIIDVCGGILKTEKEDVKTSYQNESLSIANREYLLETWFDIVIWNQKDKECIPRKGGRAVSAPMDAGGAARDYVDQLDCCFGWYAKQRWNG